MVKISSLSWNLILKHFLLITWQRCLAYSFASQLICRCIMSIEAQGSDSWIKVVQLYHYYYSLQFKEETAVLSFLLLVSHQQHAMHVFKNTARVTCGLKLRVTFCKIVLYLSLIASTLIRNSSGVPYLHAFHSHSEATRTETDLSILFPHPSSRDCHLQSFFSWTCTDSHFKKIEKNRKTTTSVTHATSRDQSKSSGAHDCQWRCKLLAPQRVNIIWFYFWVYVRLRSHMSVSM